jgi:hypothetical protein
MGKNKTATMTQTLEELFKQIAEKEYPNKWKYGAFGNRSHNELAVLQEAYARGLSDMYHALGWRDAAEPVKYPGYYWILTSSTHIFRDYLVPERDVKKDYPYATHYVLLQPPLPRYPDELEKLLMEQINKKEGRR